MQKRRKLSYSNIVLTYPLLITLLIWVVFWAEVTFGFNLNSWGIRPRSWLGLRGVIFSPFIHGSAKHALSNTVPLVVLMSGLFYFYRDIAWKVLIFGTLLTGLLTWLFARGHSTHIGASGVIYVMASFLFFKGIWSKNYRLMAFALVVVFIYGSLIWGVFPAEERVSWEGHMFGFLSGVLLAVIFRKYQVEDLEFNQPHNKRKPTPQEIEFLRHFDEEGNFIPTSERKETEALQDNSLNIEVEYKYIPCDNENPNPDTE